MADRKPIVELGPFSSVGAVPTKWRRVSCGLEDAEVYWLSTLRSDGRPHVTPLLGVWLHGALYFCTGARLAQGQGPVS